MFLVRHSILQSSLPPLCLLAFALFLLSSVFLPYPLFFILQIHLARRKFPVAVIYLFSEPKVKALWPARFFAGHRRGRSLRGRRPREDEG